MSNENCEEWQEMLAMRSLGSLSGDERVALVAHLDGCAACQALADELSATVSMLALVDPTSIEPTALVPPELSARVLGDLHRAASAHRRQRRVAAGAVSFVGAVAAALIVVAIVSGPSSHANQRTLALEPTAGVSHNAVSATAVLINQKWGTSVDFSERGLPGGSVYTVSMETANGAWWTAGTYRSVAGRTVTATMACAVALGDITGLRVENANGVTVFSTAKNAIYQ